MVGRNDRENANRDLDLDRRTTDRCASVVVVLHTFYTSTTQHVCDVRRCNNTTMRQQTCVGRRAIPLGRNRSWKRCKDEPGTGRHDRKTRTTHANRKYFGRAQAHSLSHEEDGGIECEAKEPEEANVEAKLSAEQFGDIFKFALPALGIYLTNPLMTMIDSTFVSRLCGPAQVAAMSPGGVVIDFPTILFVFLSVGTTSMVARASPNGREAIQDVLRVTMTAAIGLGLFLFASSHFYVPMWLSKLVSIPEVLPYGTAYAAVRRFSYPIVFLTMTAQASFLAQGNTLTPLRIVLAGALLNVLGDYVLMAKLGMGVAGSALATVFSQYSICGLLLYSCHTLGTLPRLLPVVPLKELLGLASFAGPLTLLTAIRLCQLMILTFYANMLGTVSLAAHQIIVAIYILINSIGEPLSQVNQTMLPKYLNDGLEHSPSQALKLVKRVLLTGLGLGFLQACMIGFLSFFSPGLFTKSEAVIVQMKKLALPLFATMQLSAILFTTEGALLAGRRYKTLLSTNIVASVGMLGMMKLYVDLNYGLASIWYAYCGQQVIRISGALREIFYDEGFLKSGKAMQ